MYYCYFIRIIYIRNIAVLFNKNMTYLCQRLRQIFSLQYGYIYKSTFPEAAHFENDSYYLGWDGEEQ